MLKNEAAPNNFDYNNDFLKDINGKDQRFKI